MQLTKTQYDKIMRKIALFYKKQYGSSLKWEVLHTPVAASLYGGPIVVWTLAPNPFVDISERETGMTKLELHMRSNNNDFKYGKDYWIIRLFTEHLEQLESASHKGMMKRKSPV